MQMETNGKYRFTYIKEAKINKPDKTEAGDI